MRKKYDCAMYKAPSFVHEIPVIVILIIKTDSQLDQKSQIQR